MRSRLTRVSAATTPKPCSEMCVSFNAPALVRFGARRDLYGSTPTQHGGKHDEAPHHPGGGRRRRRDARGRRPGRRPPPHPHAPRPAPRQPTPTPPGPILDVTMSGPSGVVWTGQCQAFIYEDKMDELPANCRAHGSNEIRWLESMGVTTVVKSYQGQMATSMTIAPDGKSATFVDNPGPWIFRGPLLHNFYFPALTEQAVSTCPIVDDVLSVTEPCETNQAFDTWKANVDAANVQYIALLKADRRRLQRSRNEEARRSLRA